MSEVGSAGPRLGPASVRRRPSLFALTWGACFLSALLLLLWSRNLHGAYLGASGVLAVAGLALGWRVRGARRDRAVLPLIAAFLALLLSLAAAATTTYQLGRISSQWDTLVSGRQTRLARDLERRMDALVRQGQDAAVRAAEVAAAPGAHGLFPDLAQVREKTGVSALAVFNSDDNLVAWAGDHRGHLPDSVRSGESRIFYAERPLFSYLYFVEPVPGTGDRAVAAILMQTGLPAGVARVPAVASRFAAATGARPLFAQGPGPKGAWSLTQGGRTVLHATLERMTQADWRAQVAGQGRRLILLLDAMAIVLLLVSWLRAGVRAAGSGAGTAVPLVALALALGVAPLGSTLGAEALSSPAYFLLPGPGELSLGMLLAVLLPLGALAATLRPLELSRRSFALALGGGAVVVGAGFVAGLRLLLDASASPLLQAGGSLWLALQPAAVLLLSMVAGVALSGVGTRPGPAARRTGARALPLVLGIGISMLLALIVLARWRAAQRVEAWPAALWGVAFIFVALGIAGYHGRGSRLARWMLAGWLASSAVLPYLWVVHVQARLEGANRELATLGTRPDPFLDYLLRHFAVEAMRRQERGESGVELVYRTWVASGFAREAYPARITLWDPSGRPLVELGLGGAASSSRPDSVPSFLRSLLSDARTTGVPVVEVMRDVPDVNQAMAVRLRGGEELSVVVPPRRSFQRSTSLAPFLGGGEAPETRLDLVPVKAGVPPPPRHIVWHSTPEGWRSEVLVHFPDGDYHAHIQVLLPSVWVRFARGVLLIALDLGFLALLWAVGRSARGDIPEPPGGWRGILRGFRARLTLALFAFFLLPTVVFGYVAYRALAGEVLRSARVVAEHAVAQASRDFPADNGDLLILSEDAGEEMLYYQGGELMAASSTEAYELGLYSTWMPPSVYTTLQSGEEVAAVEPQRLASHPYLVAYQRLPVGTLAVPVPLAAGDTAVRQRELAHLILFAALIGVLLTLGLSVAVGRALAGPISQLRRASSLVGSGRLRVRLPEGRADEFGDLFASFNRMARRLRRARAQEVQTARVLAWGEMARQVAHEIKNPLTPIKLSVQHLRRAYGDRRPDFGAILETSVDQILAEIDRLSEIARAFSRYGAPAGATGPLEAVDVRSVVHDALTLYAASEATIRYEEEVEPGLPRVRARAGELKEVILNLVENSRAAMDGAGRITVSARSQPERGGVVLEIADDGPGIPPVLLPRIFEPHFSTRSTGTGLGLAIVRRLVEGWGATVTVDSEPGEGTTVRIRISIADADAARP